MDTNALILLLKIYAGHNFNFETESKNLDFLKRNKLINEHIQIEDKARRLINEIKHIKIY